MTRLFPSIHTQGVRFLSFVLSLCTAAALLHNPSSCHDPCCRCLWSMNPAVAFKPVADAAHSVVLTSGTLAPLEGFASEVGGDGEGMRWVRK